MDYTKELADAVAARHGVGKATKKMWRHRGVIPDKYLSDEPIAPAADLSDPANRRLLEICEHPAVAPAKFRFAPKYWHVQYKTYRIRLTDADMLNLKRELVELRNLLRKCQSMNDAKKIGDAIRKEPRLKPMIIAGSYRLYDRLRGKLHCDENTLAEIKTRLAIVYSEINPA